MLSVLLTVISQLILRDDRLSGRMSRMLDSLRFREARVVIASRWRRLSAVYVTDGKRRSGGFDLPWHRRAGGVLEWCTGVAERAMGVSSLVFNYSGYGESTGRVSTESCEEDALAAYQELVSRGHRSIVLLGFSLGTGVVARWLREWMWMGWFCARGFRRCVRQAWRWGFRDG